MLRVRLLGELEVFSGDRRLALPPSRKTRALLAYLAATGRAHRRERLCSMFWDVPDDPRGALRWSLSRLRSIIDSPQTSHIVATRESVGLETAAVDVDLLRLREIDTASLDEVPIGRLTALAAMFRGEFLEGLELPKQHEFQSWCAAERENLRRLQIAILTTLIGRLADQPEAALHQTRQLIQIDPYNEAARSDLFRLLLMAGRKQEAQRQFEAAEGQFRELGDDAAARLAQKWRELKQRSLPAPPAAVLTHPMPAVLAPRGTDAFPQTAGKQPALGSSPLIGRRRELRRLVSALDAAQQLREAGVTVLLGEPGMGKSRLIGELVSIARERGIRVFTGRAYDGGPGSPYAPWLDAMNGLAPATEEVERDAGRQHFFSSAIARILGDAIEPTLIALDDVHWADEDSADFLHHLMRSSRRHPLTVVLGAREGELPDNPAMSSVLRSLRHDGLVDDLRLQPLSSIETETLVEAIAPGVQVDQTVALCGGNPLYVVELARELVFDPNALPQSLKDVLRARIERLPPQAAELLRWASILGGEFPADRLRAVSDLLLKDFMAMLDILERHSMLRPVEDGKLADSYHFSHELVRQAVLMTISGPRRKLMHLRVAEALSAAVGSDTKALEIAFHAAAGGHEELAAAACVAAARRSLRLFANADAMALVHQGLHHAEALPHTQRIERTMELLEIEVAASRSPDSTALMARIEELAGEAIDHDRPEYARRGYTLLARLRWEEGNWSDAQRDSFQAELISRSASPKDHVVAMAEAARCLTLLERDLPQAEAMTIEADALARGLGIEPDAIADAKGMLRAHRGSFDEADALFRRARLLARQHGERANEYLALEHLVTLRLARGQFGQIEAKVCAELLALAEKLREGSELPFARALRHLCELIHGHSRSTAAFETELEALRRADSKHRLTIVCSTAAGHFLTRGEWTRAKALADEALTAATAISRRSDIAVALATLAQVAEQTGSATELKDLRGQLAELSGTQLSCTVRTHVEDALSSLQATA